MSRIEKESKRRRSRRSVGNPLCDEDYNLQNDVNDPEASIRSSKNLSSDDEPQIQKRSSRRAVKRVKYAELAGVTENQILDEEKNEDETASEDKEEKQHQNDLQEERLRKRKRGRPVGLDLGNEGKTENLEIIDARDMDAEQKYELVLKMAENIKHGESVYRNAKRYGISETTIKGWLLPNRIEGFKKKAEQAARRNIIMKKHNVCGDRKDTTSFSEIYKKEFYCEIIAEILALEEETGSITQQDEADLILSEIRSSPKYKKYNFGNPPKNKHETSWLSVRTPFGKKLHEARLANIHFYDEESKEELHEATKAAEVNPFRYGMTQEEKDEIFFAVQNNINNGETLSENVIRYGFHEKTFRNWKKKQQKKQAAAVVPDSQPVVIEIKEENFNQELDNDPEFHPEEQFTLDEIYRLDGTVEVIENTVDTKQEKPVPVKNNELLTETDPEHSAACQYFKRKLMNGEHLKWTKEIFRGIIENLSNCDDKNRNKLIKQYSQTVMKLSVEVLELKNETYKKRQKNPQKIPPLKKLEPAFVVSVPIPSQSSSTAKAAGSSVKTFNPRQQVSITKMNQ